jgi:hypothetical protein
MRAELRNHLHDMKTLLIGMAVLLFAGCFEWQRDVTIKGVAFSKVRIDQGGLIIGVLKKDAVIDGRPCQQGWVHVHSNGVPAAFTAAKPIELSRFTIPAQTWVFQNPNSIVTVCAFPSDTQVQGHLCRGSGGPTGVQAAFYPSGALKQYFLRRDTKILDIPCAAGVLNQSIELHENGHLKACVLSENLTRDGRTYQKGKRLQLDPEGRILP